MGSLLPWRCNLGHGVRPPDSCRLPLPSWKRVVGGTSRKAFLGSHAQKNNLQRGLTRAQKGMACPLSVIDLMRVRPSFEERKEEKSFLCLPLFGGCSPFIGEHRPSGAVFHTPDGQDGSPQGNPSVARVDPSQKGMSALPRQHCKTRGTRCGTLAGCSASGWQWATVRFLIPQGKWHRCPHLSRRVWACPSGSLYPISLPDNSALLR